MDRRRLQKPACNNTVTNNAIYSYQEVTPGIIGLCARIFEIKGTFIVDAVVGWQNRDLNFADTVCFTNGGQKIEYAKLNQHFGLFL